MIFVENCIGFFRFFYISVSSLCMCLFDLEVWYYIKFSFILWMLIVVIFFCKLCIKIWICFLGVIEIRFGSGNDWGENDL